MKRAQSYGLELSIFSGPGNTSNQRHARVLNRPFGNIQDGLTRLSEMIGWRKVKKRASNGTSNTCMSLRTIRHVVGELLSLQLSSVLFLLLPDVLHVEQLTIKQGPFTCKKTHR